MKRVWKVLCSILLVLTASLCLMACEMGGGPASTPESGAQGGSGSLNPEVEFDDESGMLQFSHLSGYKAVVQIDGKEYPVSGMSFSVVDTVTLVIYFSIASRVLGF